MTAPSLDSHALLDLCLDTAKVAARLVSGLTGAAKAEGRQEDKVTATLTQQLSAKQ